MAYPKFNGLGDRIYWAYANLSMFFATIRRKVPKYDTASYMIRAKMFKGLRTGEMEIRSMFIDQHFKIDVGKYCAYCGKETRNLALDHILPKSKGGKDTGDNLIKVCKSCNSSKGDTDLLEWAYKRQCLISPWVVRNYLKLIYEYSEENNLLMAHRDELDFSKLPFNPNYLPMEFPDPECFYGEDL
ncbi:MAG: HNH endonuclease [Rikenellaceae bacterium]